MKFGGGSVSSNGLACQVMLSNEGGSAEDNGRLYLDTRTIGRASRLSALSPVTNAFSRLLQTVPARAPFLMMLHA